MYGKKKSIDNLIDFQYISSIKLGEGTSLATPCVLTMLVPASKNMLIPVQRKQWANQDQNPNNKAIKWSATVRESAHS